MILMVQQPHFSDILKKFMAYFCGWSSTFSTLLNQYEEFTFPVVLTQPCGFEPGAPGLEIQL